MTGAFDVTTLRGRRADRRWNRMVVGDVLERLTWSRPDKTAIAGRPGAFGSPEFASLTYRQADEAANRTAHALREQGLRAGDRVLLYCDNSVEAIIAFFGIAKAGLVAVPVNPMLAPGVLRWVVEHTEPAFAFADAEFVARAAPMLTTEPVVLPVGGADNGGSGGGTDFHDWIAGRPSHEVDGEVHADDVWSLVFTSGTTAMPKASMITHTYSYLTAYSYALSLTRGLRYEDDLRLCTFLPIVYHCGHNSAVLPAFFTGGTAILGRRADPAGLAAAVTEERATAVWAGSPAWLQKLVDEALARPDEVDLRSLTVAMFSWGAILCRSYQSDTATAETGLCQQFGCGPFRLLLIGLVNPGLFDRIREVCGGSVELLEVFGQTESMSCYRFWPDRDPAKRAGAQSGVNHVGVPNPMLAADIVDVTGASLRGKPGEPGEAVYRSPVLTAGYYRDEEATAEAFRDGWFHSGDSCAYESDGDQIMVDRFKDIVKTGGENVSSLRVEGVLAEHPAVHRVAVIGIPDEKWGELVAAVVTTTEPRPDEAALIAFARESLAGYECPKRIFFVDEMPETVGGKILKYKLRQRFG